MKNPFEYQAPTVEHVKQITAFREKCKELSDMMSNLPAFNKHMSIEDVPSQVYAHEAHKKLEEFSMWINKAIVFGD